MSCFDAMHPSCGIEWREERLTMQTERRGQISFWGGKSWEESDRRSRTERTEAVRKKEDEWIRYR